MDIKGLKKFIPIIILVIIFIIINSVILKNANSLRLKNKKIKAEINKKTEELAKGTNIASVKETLNSEIGQLNLKLSSIEERFFLNPGDIFTYINHFAEATKISLKSIEPREKTQQEIPKSKNLYLELPVNLKIKCDYCQLLAFLNKIETAEKLIMVSEVKIQSDPNNIWEHDIQILLKASVLLTQEAKSK